MIYQFHHDGCGEVAAEAREADMQPYLGLRYPASDIPVQARALMLRNTVRINTYTDDDGVDIEPRLSGDGQPLDLSNSGIRLQSRIHQKYLQNMGVQATVTISLICDGALFGLIACHHNSSYLPSMRLRAALELYGCNASAVLETLNGREHLHTHALVQDAHQRIACSVAEDDDLEQSVEILAHELARVIHFDGHAARTNGQILSDGITLSRGELLPLLEFLNTTSPREVFHTSRLQGVFPQAASYSNRVCGVLAVPISRHPQDYLLLFRGPMVEHITWAGQPSKSVAGEQITPRKSFAAWRELKADASATWITREISLAEAVRVTLLEVILRITDAAVRERKRATDRQELLIAELNHRVRNILTLIKNLVEQSNSGTLSPTDFSQAVGGRLHALAEAYSLITRKAWNPTSIRELLAAEIRVFADQEHSRVDVSGTDVLITPQAASTLALVMHEMITNASKYGALSTAQGKISICIEPSSDNGVHIHWTESGGPTVTPPSRHGFGTTIASEALPHEFGGLADICYELSGVRAAFYLPAAQVTEILSEISHSQLMDPILHASAAPTLNGPERLLIVEDLGLLAKGTKLLAERLGVRDVIVAAGVAEAMDALDQGGFDGALLDHTPGDGASHVIARELKARSIPFAILTSSEAVNSMSADYPGTPILTKPIKGTQLQELLGDFSLLGAPFAVNPSAEHTEVQVQMVPASKQR